MEITGIEINAEWVPHVGNENSSGYFRAFMFYCIDNYYDRIIMSNELKKWFSPIENDPMFKSAVQKGSVCGHNGLYFSLNNGTPDKIGIMYHIANMIGIGLYVYTMG
jgi:hypothetical protein